MKSMTMSCVRKSKLKLSYWLTVCVLLFYQQAADMALAMQTGKTAEDFEKEIGSQMDVNGPHIDPLNPQCADWEVFNGADCVCADDASARCTDKGGMVCDNTGSQYKSTCAFALDMCSKNIPQDRTIETCGFCTHLRLVSGQDSRVVRTFTRTAPQTSGLDVEYQSNSDDLLLFHPRELGAWAVGRRGAEGTVIAMTQVKSSAYPQDNDSGMLVAAQKGDKIDWQTDPFMHFECVQTRQEMHTPDVFHYHDVGIDASHTTSFLFEVQACSDAHILLMKNPGDEDRNLIEIVIGGWKNTKSVVRTFKQRRRNIVARAHHPDHRPLDCHNPKPFWISWADGVFQVGSGLTVGTGRFLSYNSQSTPIVRSVAVSTGFGSTGTWTFDVTETHRQKRFVIAALIFVGLAATATSTTLHVVQSAKGCLYYPSVCTLRDRIRDRLKPEVTNSQNSFISIYGDPGKFKERVDKIHDQTLDIRDKVTTIKELNGQLQLHLSDIVKISSSIKDEFPDFKNTLASYNDWAKAKAITWKMDLIALGGEIFMAISSTSAAAVSFCTLAIAGIGALAAVGWAAVDIISSVKEEKQLRDQLRDTESKYLKAKADLESAFSNIKAFQKMFCSNIIAYYRDISVKGRTYDKTFEALYSYIIKWYGDSSADCETKYGNSNLETLTELSNNVLQPLVNFLSKDIEKLRTKIVEVKETNLYLSEIKKMVKSDKMSPIAIFRAITASKPKFMGNVFTTLWDLLYFVAIEVLPTTECYEGYNLGRIRAGSMTKDNYNEHPVCHSGDIQADVTKIRQEVSKGFAPCKIFQQVKTAAFRSQYSVIKYIAEHLLKTSSCYWGYDLKFIRNDDSNVHDLREIDTALINSVLFQTLAYFQKNSVISNDQIRRARHVLCTSYHVCSTTWQTFIFCQTWSGHDVTKLLGCTNTGNTDTSVVCVPGTQQFEMCKEGNSVDPHLPYIR